MTPEGTVLAACKRYLGFLKSQRALTFRRIHVMPVTRGTGFRKFTTANTDMLGMPDLLVFIPQGKTLHVECKSEKGKLSPHQEAYARDISSVGHEYHIVREVTELQKILVSHGVDIWSIQREVNKG